MELVKKRKITAHAMLISAAPAQFGDRELLLHFPPTHRFHRDKVSEPGSGYLSPLVEAFFETFGVRPAVRCVLAGELYLSDKMKEKMLHRLVSSRKEEVVFSIDTLSDREMEVFQLIGNGYSTRQIAGKLNLSVKTIDSYREHLKLKLKLKNSGELVRYAVQWTKSETAS